MWVYTLVSSAKLTRFDEEMSLLISEIIIRHRSTITSSIDNLLSHVLDAMEILFFLLACPSLQSQRSNITLHVSATTTSIT